jgi:hypothetical protein
MTLEVILSGAKNLFVRIILRRDPSLPLRMTAFAMCAVLGGTVQAASFKLYQPGEPGPVDYKRYGKFSGIGTSSYAYKITDEKGLARVVGEGIFPNRSVLQDPEYKKLLSEGKLSGSHWDFFNNKNYEINLYQWMAAQEDPGVKQFYIARLFESLGLWVEAMKAYYAIAVHFPRTVSWTYWQTPWYVGPVALDRLEILCRLHPEIGLHLKGGEIRVINGFDDDIQNDVFVVDPGRLVKGSLPRDKASLDRSKIKRTLGGSNTQLVQYANGHWQLLVHGQPFIVKAVAYSPNTVGKSPDRGTLVAHRDWQIQDENHNGIHDSLFESWVDQNFNNRQDADEPTIGDAVLLKKMGANTIRVYHHIYNKPLFRKLYDEYGLRVMVGDLLGGYAVDSGADWKSGTDYANPEQRTRMLASVESMVKENRDEPYALFWVLGNENVYGAGNNSNKNPEAFYSLVEEAARLIHGLDPTRPVAVANGDLAHLDLLAKLAPSVDIIGANAYRGNLGFGRSFFRNIREWADRPALVTEFGCPATADGFTAQEALDTQAEYVKNNWEDLAYHFAGSGEGNAIGGVVFEWLDEWWKANSDMPERVKKAKPRWYAEREAAYHNLQPENHDTVPQFGAPFLDGWSYEEWFGIFGQGNGSHSPFLREPRPLYDVLKKLWNQD